MLPGLLQTLPVFPGHDCWGDLSGCDDDEPQKVSKDSFIDATVMSVGAGLEVLHERIKSIYHILDLLPAQ